MEELITIKSVTDVDFLQYKRPSMFISFPYCTFKCGKDICQNYPQYGTTKNIVVPARWVVDRYVDNPISEAFVFGGFEPLDSFEDVAVLIRDIRSVTNDVIIVYTGYEIDEPRPKNFVQFLENADVDNVIVKYGRYRPDLPGKFDPLLGITLASNNQFAVLYSSGVRQ